MFLLLLLNLTFHQLDTTRVYQKQEVVITATRTPINSIDAPSRVTKINVGKMQDAGFADTKSMLSLVDGIFVNDHGPAQIGTVCLRGTSSEQTLFMLDGVSLNNVQDGDLDLFLVPTNELSSIEISQGGSSALYGANAVGGVINLESKTPSENLIRIDLGGGSYGNQMMGGEISEGLGTVRIELTAQRQRGVNDYDFTFNSGTSNFPMTLVGADYLEDAQSLKIALPSSRGMTSLLIQNVSADRGTPSPATDSTLIETSRETDKSTIAILKNVGNLGAFNYSTSAGFIYSYLKYVQPDTYNIPYDTVMPNNDYYKTISLQPSIQLSYLQEKLSGTAGIDAEFDQGQSDEMMGVQERKRIGAFASGEYDLRDNLDLDTRVFGALRYDDYSDFGSSFNPKAGINVKPLAALPLHLRTNVGTSYRVPTFDELYYAGAGNPDLKPEKSTDYDFGAEAEFVGNRRPFFVDLGVDYYHIDTRNGIVWRPTDPSELIWLPENFQKITSHGIELSFNLNYESLITLKGNYFFGKSLDVSDQTDPTTYEKQLIYIPQEQSSISVEVTPWILNFTAALRYVGQRFYTSDNTEWLSPYAVTYVSASARIDAGSFELLPRFSIDDLFNREYEVIPDYPMPGRIYRLGVSFQLSQGK